MLGSWKSAVKATLLIGVGALLVSCNPDCSDEWFWKDCDHVVSPEVLAVQRIQEFRNAAKAFAGPKSVSVDVLQSARPGDLWVLHDGDTRLTSRGGNIFRDTSSQEYANAIESSPLSSIATSFDWSREFSQGVNIEFVDLALKAAFDDARVGSVAIRLEFEGMQQTQFKQPSALLQDYENVNKCIRANCMLSSTIHGRLKVHYTARDTNKEEVRLDIKTIISNINVAVGYERAEEVTSETNVIIESPSSGSVLAATWLKISAANQDAKWVEDQIKNPDDNIVLSIPIGVTSNGNWIPVAEFKFRARANPSGDGTEISLSIFNRDPSERAISFAYSIRILDGTSELFKTEGNVTKLPACGSEEKGVVAIIPRPVNWLLRAKYTFWGSPVVFD